MPLDIPRVQEVCKDLEGTHKFLAEELLIPNLNKCDSVRVNMFDNHLPQALVLENPDFPNVFTNFENQVGKYSTGYKKSDREWEILKKFKKNDMNFTYLLKDKDNNLEIFHVKPAERITERYGYTYNNPVLEKDTGDFIDEDEVLYSSTTYDKDMNFCYGRNLKAVFLAAFNLTYEDGIICSESAAEKLGSYSVDEIDISLNNNDILLNLLGNNKVYKAFPDIGEKCNSTILCSRRRIDYESMLFEMNAKNIKKINPDIDSNFFVSKDSIVYDVDVYCNGDPENLKEYPYYNQIMKYYNMNYKYYYDVVTTIAPYMEDSSYNCSSDVKYFYKRSIDMISENTQFTFDGNAFDNMIVKIRTYNKKPLVKGSKITGRYGSKGVISAIMKDSDMPTNEYGEHAELILNPFGVIGRENIAQLYELELNFMGDQVLRQTKSMDSVKEKFDHILKFYKIVNEEQYKFIKGNVKSLGDKEQFINDSYEHGLYIHQPPFFNNVTVNKMNDVYKEFGFEPYHCKISGKEIEKPLVIGNLYYLRLKHDPSTKLSARSSGDLSLNNIPSKSNSYKYHTSLFSKTPVRCGEMEFNSLLLTQNMPLVMRYLAQTSNNPEERKNFNTALLTKNVFDIDKIDLIGSKSITSRIVKTQMLTLGLVNKQTIPEIIEDVENVDKELDKLEVESELEE